MVLYKRCSVFKQVWPIIKEHLGKVDVNEMANVFLDEGEGYTEFSVGVGAHSIQAAGKKRYLVSYRLTVRIDDEAMPELQQAVTEGDEE